MSKYSIKSICLLFLVVIVGFFLLPNDLLAQSRRTLRKQAEELSYQQAGGSEAVSVATSDKWSANPNATMVRNESQMTPTQRMICDLTNSKAELQKEIDQLGEKLQRVRGSKAREITEELEVLASQIALIDLKLAALPKEESATGSESYTNSKPFHNLVDSLVDHRLEENGYGKGSALANNAVSRIVYHVQLAVTTRPNVKAFSDLDGVEMTQRSDGKYAYYYGDYSSYSQAQSACRRVRSSSKYRDAFVVALRGAQRITIQEAARLIAQ